MSSSLPPLPSVQVVMDLAPWLPNGVYPMDFYSDAGGPWANYHEKVKRDAAAKAARLAARAAAAGGGEGAEGEEGLVRRHVRPGGGRRGGLARPPRAKPSADVATAGADAATPAAVA